ncbi:MAG: hypothetical protein Q4B26_11080 [Eubacteriales bacterium]|nr:hypothetical protein [Eubacteriales bacterium]
MKENRLSVAEAADLMGVSAQSIRVGMQQGVLDIGYCFKNSSVYTYIIPVEKFKRATGIKVIRNKE